MGCGTHRVGHMCAHMHVHTHTCTHRGVPYVGPMVQAPFSDFLEKQKARLHRKSGEKLVHVSVFLLVAITILSCVQESSVIQRLFGYFLLIMVVYFVLSIVHSMAQNYAKRRQEELHPNTNHKLQ